MKQTLIYILVCVLLCSIALNVFQAVKKPESLDAGTVAPTTDAPTTAPATTAPEEEELTLVELAAITEFINYLRRHFLHNAIHFYSLAGDDCIS